MPENNKGHLTEEALKKSLETSARAKKILEESADALKKAQAGLDRSRKRFETLGLSPGGTEIARKRDAWARTAEDREDLERERIEFHRLMREEMKRAVEDLRKQDTGITTRKGPRKNIVRV